LIVTLYSQHATPHKQFKAVASSLCISHSI